MEIPATPQFRDPTNHQCGGDFDGDECCGRGNYKVICVNDYNYNFTGLVKDYTPVCGILYALCYFPGVGYVYTPPYMKPDVRSPSGILQIGKWERGVYVGPLSPEEKAVYLRRG
jgi:hypothetical protein